MLRIRLRRRGKTKYATYRVVVAQHHLAVKGKYIADVGLYNPHTDEFAVDGDAIKKWIAQGAQPSPTIHNLLVNHKVIDSPKVTTWKPKKKKQAAEVKAG